MSDRVDEILVVSRHAEIKKESPITVSALASSVSINNMNTSYISLEDGISFLSVCYPGIVLTAFEREREREREQIRETLYL